MSGTKRRLEEWEREQEKAALEEEEESWGWVPEEERAEEERLDRELAQTLGLEGLTGEQLDEELEGMGDLTEAAEAAFRARAAYRAERAWQRELERAWQRWSQPSYD